MAIPAVVMQLVHRIDSGDATFAECEKLIAADPGLTARLLKTMGAVDSNGLKKTCPSVRHTVMRHGLQAVRAFAVSTVIQGCVGVEYSAKGFDLRRYARHSFLTGLLAMSAAPNGVNEAELLTFGVLHDIAAALLARSAPAAYEHVANYACRCGVSLDVAFFCLFGVSFQSLAAVAVRTWGLGESLATELERFSEDDGAGVGSLVRLASFVADDHGFTLEPWPVEAVAPPQLRGVLDRAHACMTDTLTDTATLANELTRVLLE